MKIQQLNIQLHKEKVVLRALVRTYWRKFSHKRDSTVSPLLTHSPQKLYSTIRKNKGSSTPVLHLLNVGDKTYEGSQVSDGFYAALSDLKNSDLHAFPTFDELSQKDNYLFHLGKAGLPIPQISLQETGSILKKMKPSVSDLYSITPKHYLTAGESGTIHFYELLKMISVNVELPELKSAQSIVLHKGHGKPCSSHRSYCCISTCPRLSKGMDCWIGTLRRSYWNSLLSCWFFTVYCLLPHWMSFAIW